MGSPRADALPVTLVVVEVTGVVAARNAGLDAVRSDVIGFFDDDTIPHPDWSERALAHFVADPRLGGLGGKDRIHDGVQRGRVEAWRDLCARA